MSRFQFKLSDIGEGIAEAELVEWLVAVGDVVKEDQPVASFMTDKATVELETPVGGTVVARSGEIGEAIRVGATILEIETTGDVAPEPEAEVAEPETPPNSALPAIARESVIASALRHHKARFLPARWCAAARAISGSISPAFHTPDRACSRPISKRSSSPPTSPPRPEAR